MALDYAALQALRAQHAGWRLLRDDDAALLAGLLERVFVAGNARSMPSCALAEALEDELFQLRRAFGEDAFPRAAPAYLDDWTDADKGWLREFYPHGADEPHYEPTAETLKALAWLDTLLANDSSGTESRVAMLLELVEQMSEKSDSDPGKRLDALRRRRDAIEAEMARVAAGDVPVLEATALKERFEQFMRFSRELLIEFRAVEQRLRRSDRRVRERLAAAGDRAVAAETTTASNSDATRSLEAAWMLLRSRSRHEVLSEQVARLLTLPPVAALGVEPGTQRAPFDWFQASEHARETREHLQARLQRFFGERAWLANQRIADTVANIEANAIALAEVAADEVMRIAHARAAREPGGLPAEPASEQYDEEVENRIEPTAAPWDESIDRDRLAIDIRDSLATRGPRTLDELIEAQPLQHGLAELLTYIRLAHEQFELRLDAGNVDTVAWHALTDEGVPARRRASLPRIVLSR